MGTAAAKERRILDWPLVVAANALFKVSTTGIAAKVGMFARCAHFTVRNCEAPRYSNFLLEHLLAEMGTRDTLSKTT